MAGAIIKSVLEEALEKLGTQNVKKQSIVNGLKKRGVKDIELEQSGAKAFIDSYQGERVSASEMLESIQLNRPDNIDTTKLHDDEYKEVTEKISDKFDYNTKTKQFEPIRSDYGVDIYTKDIEHSMYNHFDNAKYYAHTRHTDVGEDRIVHEIQSDVHVGTKEPFNIDDTIDQMVDRFGLGTFESADYEKSRSFFEETAEFTTSFINSKEGKEKLMELGERYGNEHWNLDNMIGLLEELNINKSFKQEPNYLTTTVNKMLVDAANEGKSTVKVRISPDEALKRSENVQRWYENDVTNRLTKTAKQIGAEHEITSDGYFKLKLPPNFKLPLYSAGAAAVVVAGSVQDAKAESVSKSQASDWKQIQEALPQGYSREEIVSRVHTNNPDKTLDEVDASVIGSIRLKINEARENHDDSVIIDDLILRGYDRSIIDAAMENIDVKKSWKAYEWDPNTVQEEAKDLSDLYKNIYSKRSTMGKSIQGFFNTEKALEARKEINQLNASIAAKMQEQGFDTFVNPESGDLMVRDEKGNVSEVDEGILNSLYNEKGELALGIAGAYAGYKTGKKVGKAIGTVGGGIAGGIAGNLTGVGLALPEEALTVPGGAYVGSKIGDVAGSVIGTAGGFVGSMAGVYLGRGADLTINAYKLKEKLTADLYMSQMKEAAIFDGVVGVVGGAVFKIGAKGAKQVMKAYDYALAGNPNGALKALKEGLHISDDQAQEITDGFIKKLAKKPRKPALIGTKKLSKTEEQILAITSTAPGGEKIIGKAVIEDLKASTSVAKGINFRAKEINKIVNEMSDKNVGSLVRKDLNKYVSDVKDFYGSVKDIGSDAIDGTDFKFDFAELAIDPVMENIGKKLSDVSAQERFLLYSNRIAGMSDDRSFSGLVELRQVVNSFKYSSKKLSKPDADALNGVINKIDGKISKAAKEYMSAASSKEWIGQFKAAKSEYSMMKRLEENALYKNIQSAAKSEKLIQNTLNKYGNNLDVDFEVLSNVTSRLSPKTKNLVEVAAIKNVVNKNTYGKVGEDQAVDFLQLSDSLKELKVDSQEGKYLTKVVDDLAKVFRNDPKLASVSGNMAVPRFAASLGADLGQKARYAVIGEVWNSIKTLSPGMKANNMALINKVGKLLENPLSFKEADKFVNSFPKEEQSNIQQLIKQLRVSATKEPAKRQDFKNMYKQSASGKFTTSNGALGRGVYLVDKVKNPKQGSNIIKQEVNMSRMATIEDISSILGREVSEKEIRTIPNIQKELLDRGFNGISLDNKAMLFNEQSTSKILNREPIEKVTE